MGGVCYLSMGMVVLLMGLVFASVYIYRYFFLAQVRPGKREALGSGKGGVCRELQGGVRRAAWAVEYQGLGAYRGGAASDLPHGWKWVPSQARSPVSFLYGAALGRHQPTWTLAWSGRQEWSPVLLTPTAPDGLSLLSSDTAEA